MTTPAEMAARLRDMTRFHGVGSGALSEAADMIDAMQAQLDAANAMLTELVASIDKRWGEETATRRERALSPRIEEALSAARAALAKLETKP